jgi:phosphate transport system protein
VFAHTVGAGMEVAGMREEFRAELAEVSRTLVTMAEAVRSAMRQATASLLSVDTTDAEEVVAHDAEIDALYRIVEDNVYDVLARQAPVASDLRLVITALHVAGDLERMGDLADHVAQTMLRRYPTAAVPQPLTGLFQEMGDVADRIAGKIAKALSTADPVVVFSSDWADALPAAVDAALLGRYYERYADHAVNAGRHVVFLATGESLAQ